MLKCFSFLFILLLLNNNNVLCEEILDYNSPNPELSPSEINRLETANSEIVYDEVPNTGLVLEHEIIEEQADQPTSGEHFVAIRVDAAVGATEQLSPTLKGLETMAITYLPRNYIYVNVISATREVVAGVRYNLIVEAIGPNTDSILCELIILEKPWIVNEWGTKKRTLTYTNCTDIQETNKIPETINTNNDGINPVFQNTNNNDMTDERLKALEDLIIPVQREYRNRRPITRPIQQENINILRQTNFQSHTRLEEESDVTTEQPIVLSNQNKQFLADFFSSNVQSYNNDNNIQQSIREHVVRTQYDEVTIPNPFGMQVTSESYNYESTPLPLDSHFEDIQSKNIEQWLDVVSTTEESINQENVSDNSEIAYAENHVVTESNQQPLQAEVTVIYPRFDLNAATTEVYYNYDESSTVSTVDGSDDNGQVRISNCGYSDFHQVPVTESLTEFSRDKRNTDYQNAYFLEVSKQALQQLDRIDIDNYKRVVLNLMDAKEVQKNVREKYIILQLKIANSHCMEDSTNLDECKQSIVVGSTKYCTLEVRESDAPLQVTKSECSPAKIQKRQIGLVGAPTTVNLQQNSDIVNYLNQAIVSVNGQEQENYVLLEILEATEQVVAGSLYKIRAKFSHKNADVICNYEIWDRPWITVDGREITVNCDNQKAYNFHQNSASSRVRRHILGAPEPSQDFGTIQELVDEAFVNINGQENSEEGYEFQRIVSSTKQVVAGLKYFIVAEFTHKNSDIVCNLTIWDRPWIKIDGRDVKVACENEKKYDFLQTSGAKLQDDIERAKRQTLVGAPTSVDPNDSEVSQYLKDALVTVNGQEGDQGYVLLRIIESTQQVVAGVKYVILAEFAHKKSNVNCTFTIWDQPWIAVEGRNVNVDCENEKNYNFLQSAKVKRQIGLVGAPTPVDANENSTVRTYLNEVLVTVNEQAGVDKYTFVNILEASHQVISGSLYRVKVELTHKNTQVFCNFKIWDRPWVNAEKRKFEAKCNNRKKYSYPEDSSEESSEESDESSESSEEKRPKKFKRQIGVPGGVSPVSVDDPSVVSILNEVLVGVNGAETEQGAGYTLVRILESTKQVVAGHKYVIKAEFSHKNSNVNCTFTIWDRPWITPDGRQSDVSCENDKKYNFRQRRSLEVEEQHSDKVKRQVGVLGGLSPIPVDDPTVVSILNEVLVGVNGAETEQGAGYTLVRILESTKQVVAGHKYVIKAEFSHKNSNVNCTFTIWDRPWITPDGRQSDVSCENDKKYNFRQRRSLDVEEQHSDKVKRQIGVPGGLSPIPVDDPTVVSFLNQALVGVNGAETEQNADYTLVRILESTMQVVAGHKYVIKAEFAHKKSNVNCTFTIWDQPWVKPDGRQIDVHCENEKKYNFHQESTASDNHSHKVKRQIGVPGGVSPVSVDDPSVVSILNEVLVGVNGAETEQGAGYTLVRILESTKQVVAGHKYVIKAEFSHKNSNVNCTFTIWDRPWITPDGRQSDVSCENDKKYNFRQRRSLDVEEQHFDKVKRQVGGVSHIPVDDPSVVNYLNEALVGINGADTEEGASYTLVRILESTRQVVSGHKYVIKAEFSHKNSIVNCTFTIWDRPWIKQDGKQTDVSCENEKKYNFRQKRSLSYDLELDRELYSDDLDINVLFAKYKNYYSKIYPTTREHTMRLRIFKDSLIKIKQLNKHEKGTATYGVTEFSDLTTQEFRQRTGLLRSLRNENDIRNPIAVIPDDIRVPRAFDWRDRNVVTQVKNQGNCGSCWAFSVTGNIEGLNAIKTGQLQEFSEQELVDCDTVDQGCNGGLPDNAYKAIEQIGGLESESEYPYNAHKNSCHFNRTLAKVSVKGAVDLPKNETAMAQWLLSNGPISIGINAAAMQFYRGGVSHPWHPLCRSSGIDHGVLIVGFGISDYPLFKKKLPYWIVKNSWGPNWGEQGYYRVFRGDNTCGVSDMASSAIID